MSYTKEGWKRLAEATTIEDLVDAISKIKSFDQEEFRENSINFVNAMLEMELNNVNKLVRR